MVWKKKKWVLFLVALFIISYTREVVFMSVNQYISGQSFFYGPTKEFSFFASLNNSQLIQLKYLLTATYTAIFIFTTVLAIRKSFDSEQLNLGAYSLYGLLLFIILILTVSSFFLNSWETFYPIIRKLIGWIHNPLIYMLLSVSHISLLNLRTSKN